MREPARSAWRAHGRNFTISVAVVACSAASQPTVSAPTVEQPPASEGRSRETDSGTSSGPGFSAESLELDQGRWRIPAAWSEKEKRVRDLMPRARACELRESIRSLRGGERRIFEATFEDTKPGELAAHLKRVTQALQLKPDETAPWGNYFASSDGAFRFTALSESVEVQLKSSLAQMSGFLTTLMLADRPAEHPPADRSRLRGESRYGVRECRLPSGSA
jgi:hypothetical protein